MGQQDVIYDTIPVGSLGVIALKSSEELGNKVNNYLVTWRNNRDHEHASTIAFAGYQRDSYLIDSKCPRFGTGEAKGMINESVRGVDLYILVDVTNEECSDSIRFGNSSQTRTVNEGSN